MSSETKIVWPDMVRSLMDDAGVTPSVAVAALKFHGLTAPFVFQDNWDENIFNTNNPRHPELLRRYNLAATYLCTDKAVAEMEDASKLTKAHCESYITTTNGDFMRTHISMLYAIFSDGLYYIFSDDVLKVWNDHLAARGRQPKSSITKDKFCEYLQEITCCKNGPAEFKACAIMNRIYEHDFAILIPNMDFMCDDFTTDSTIEDIPFQPLDVDYQSEVLIFQPSSSTLPKLLGLPRLPMLAKPPKAPNKPNKANKCSL